MTLILVVAGLTLMGSFLCSLFEAALYSITPSQVALLLQSKRKGAEKLAELRSDMEAPIAAILTVNTITHTVGASVCGALVAGEYGNGSPAVGIFAALFTFAVLLLTEIIPKSYGVKHATTIGPMIVWPLQVMIWSVWPVVSGSRWLMKLLTGGAGHGGTTEAEVLVMSRLAHEEGAITHQEHRWVERALHLDKLKARDVMTPRTVVERVKSDVTFAELRQTAVHWKHSRIPVVSPDDPDHVQGLAHRRTVMDALLNGIDDAETVKDLMVSMDFVPEHAAVPELLDQFIKKRVHLMAVVDEYGSFQGVVTLEDVVEEMLGSEILDETDEIADKQAHARRQAKERFTDE
jgi:CBS domain containing-hemolysin-like protein